MKLLLIHQFYTKPAVGGALRSYYLAQALLAHGVTPVVITTHNASSIFATIEDSIEVHYLPVIYNNRFGFFKRIFSFGKFVWNTVTYAGRFRDVQLVYAISTPLTTGLAAIWIRWRYRIPYVFEVGDLWPDAPIQLGIVRNPILKWILYGLEKKIYQKATAVVALSPAIREVIEQRVPGKQVHMLPNMADTQFFSPQEKPKEQEVRYGVGGKFVISYLGTLGRANGLEYLMDCARTCRDKNLPVHFLIAGDGLVRDQLEESISKINFSNITLLPFQNREGIREILSVTDAVMVCFQPVPVLETGCPNKLFDGLAAGKLIIINFGGWLKALVKENQCGIVVDPRRPEDFVEQIKAFNDDPEKLKRYERASRQLAEANYSRKLLSEQFVEIIKSAVT
jgi:glycosyltransferase involved in cell wall biosynthesis